MFLLDTLMIAGLRWTLDTIRTAADAEGNDETALRERLLDAGMRREMGEIDEEEFVRVEREVLARIREIRERREGGGALAFGLDAAGAQGEARFRVDASIAGDFHETAVEPPAKPVAPRPRRAPAAGGRTRPARGKARATRRT